VPTRGLDRSGRHSPGGLRGSLAFPLLPTFERPKSAERGTWQSPASLVGHAIGYSLCSPLGQSRSAPLRCISCISGLQSTLPIPVPVFLLIFSHCCSILGSALMEFCGRILDESACGVLAFGSAKSPRKLSAKPQWQPSVSANGCERV
jgi:hypothetical protein